MTPLDPAELSAYVDGELPAERMREIERIAPIVGRNLPRSVVAAVTAGANGQ